MHRPRGEHKVAVVDMETLKTIAKTGPVKYPDGIAYAPSAKRVFVSDEHGNADAVIDATTNSLVTTIPLVHRTPQSMPGAFRSRNVSIRAY
jgi:DNA-binding beta-propeller fold protein YncE